MPKQSYHNDKRIMKPSAVGPVVSGSAAGEMLVIVPVDGVPPEAITRHTVRCWRCEHPNQAVPGEMVLVCEKCWAFNAGPGVTTSGA